MTKEQTILITPQGYLALETELNDLKLKKRPEVIAALQEARSLGDLSENAEYDAARNEQAQVEARIKELEFKLEPALEVIIIIVFSKLTVLPWLSVNLPSSKT